ncbi:MAG TPA: glycosyltransferase family 2 protein [Candidatus Nanoarchaeia archaeon]|nr:glycosyltransferase family 2 protein [Candidatus Nanoarchaeia archaeon]
MIKKEKKIAIFIPVYNAAKTLPIVIDRIPERIKKKVKEIIVIDNASPDNTYLIAVGYKHKKKLSNLNIIKNQKNLGYGGSQKVAYKYVIKRGYDIVVMLHGDAQYAPEFIPQLLEPLENDEADLVFGSRIKGEPLKGGMPVYKYIGNRILTFIENLVLKMDLSEYHSGYRIFNVQALKKVPFNHCSDDYLFDTDILIQFRIMDLRIKEKPIPTHYGEESHSPSMMQLVRYSYNIMSSLGYYLLHKWGIKTIKKFDINGDR